MEDENKKQFEKLFEEIFPNFKCKQNFEKNNFSGALIGNNFPTFKENFLDKIRKIKSSLDCSYNLGCCIEKLKEQICLIGNNKNHEGAYSEIVAFYNLTQRFRCDERLKCEVNVDSSETLGKYFGKTKTNYDFQIGDVCIDVKAFTDKRSKLIIDNFHKIPNNSQIHLLPEFDMWVSYEGVTSHISEITQELKNIVNMFVNETEKTTKTIHSTILEGLRYKILIGSGVNMAIEIHNPYLYAEQEHQVIFQHLDKLHISKPTVLIYVINPWFSDKNISNGFDDSKKEALRSIARRIFMQYKDKKINVGKKQNSKYILNPFKYLSGLIFITDMTLRKENEDEIYFFKNPNAENKLPDSFIMRFHDFQTYYDDFEYDNY